MSPRKKIGILISGRGSNMVALINAAAENDYPAEITCVISDNADAIGLAVAESMSIATHSITRSDFPDKAAHEAEIERILQEEGVEIICLAGYMRLLSADFVTRWEGRILNIHPSLLPLFRGLDTHKRALEAGVRLHGCTVHFVSASMDEGPIIAQSAVPVLPTDTEPELAQRVLKMEHKLYPIALSMVVTGRVTTESDKAVFLNTPDISWGQNASLQVPSSIEAIFNIEDLARRTP